MSTPEVKAAIDSVNRAFEEFKAANDIRLAELDGKISADVLNQEKVDRINGDITTLQNAVNEANRKLARVTTGGGGDVDPAKAEYRNAFFNWFKTGDGENELKVRNAATVKSDPDGGFTVPDEMQAAIDRVQGTYSVMRSVARVQPISSQAFTKLVNVGGSTYEWVGETEARAETNTPTLKKLRFPAMTLSAKPQASQDVLDDSPANIEAWLADEVGIAFAEGEGDAFIDGTGVDQPQGILSYTNVANASYAWGNVGYLASGAASSLGTSDQLDKFLSVVYGLKRSYRSNAQWIMNDATQNTIRQIKDGTGNYMWQPSVQAGTPATFIGYGVQSDDNMPDIGTNTYPVAFGDWMRAYIIVDRIGIRVLRDPYSNKPYVQFYTTKRVGGGIQNFEALKLLKIAAS